MGELRSKAGAGGHSGHSGRSGQKEWVKSMVDYLAAPTAGPAHIRDLQSCSTSIAAKIIVLEGVCALVISATFHLKTLDLVQCSQCSVTVKILRSALSCFAL